MKAYLYQLQFETPVHFGASDSALSLYASEDHFCADTLFSALCHTACAVEGTDAASLLCEDVRQGNLLLSDSMPWKENSDGAGEDAFFIPRPMLLSRKEVPHERLKAMKKRNWIPVRMADAFLSSVSGGAEFDPLEIPVDFGKSAVVERVAVARSEGQDAEPYPVGLYRFHPDCGLYFIALVRDADMEHRLRTLVKGLGLSGIGGKTASGYGKFSLKKAVDLESGNDQQSVWIRDALRRENTPRQLLLTASLPRGEEMPGSLDGAGFQMIRRAGFLHSASAEQSAAKKHTQYFLSAGSVLCRRFSGGLYTVGGGKNHPAVRYSRPVFLGLPQE